MALDNTKIKSKTTLDAVLALNKLGENNQVLIRWIPAHSGYLENKKADSLDKRGANNTDATSVSRISRDGDICSEEILDLGGNFGIQEEILTDLERIHS